MTERTIDLGGRDMAVISFGSGSRNLVIIAGLSLTGIRGLGEAVSLAYHIFTRDYTVWLMERADTLPEGTDTAYLAEDIVAAMNICGIESADFLGVSQGGMIAQLLAAAHPERVSSMVLCSSVCYLGDTAKKTLPGWLRLAEQGDIPGLNRSFYGSLYTPEFVKANAAALEAIMNTGTPDQCRRFATLARAAECFDSRPVLDKITCPVLVIGDEDDMVLGADVIRETAERLGCECYFYRGYGHAVYDTAPDIKQRMLTFFQKHRG